MKHFEIKKTEKLDCSPIIQNGLTAAQQVEKMWAMYSNIDDCSDCFDDDEEADPEQPDYSAAAPQKILTAAELSALSHNQFTRYFGQLVVASLNNPLAHDKSN